MGELLAGFARDRLRAKRAAVLYEVGRTYSAAPRAQLHRPLQRRRGRARGRRSSSTSPWRPTSGPSSAGSRSSGPTSCSCPGSFPDATLVAAQARAVGLRVDAPRRRRLVEPAALPARRPPGEAYYVELCSPAPEFDRRYEETEGREPPGLPRRPRLRRREGNRGRARARSGRLPTRPSTRHWPRRAVASATPSPATRWTAPPAASASTPHGDRRQGVALYSVEKAPLGPPRALVRGWLGEP